MKKRVIATSILFVLSFSASCGVAFAAKAPKPVSAKRFDALAGQALEAMKARAAELNISGVAVISYSQGETIQSWISKMAVVGRMVDTKASANGNNLLGIAYAKSAEMAETLQDSGTTKRPPMTGEFGWQGGVIAKTATGYIIVAFSGGKSEDDVQVSRAGLALLKPAL